MWSRIFICTVMVAMLCGVTASSVGADNGKSASVAEDTQLPKGKQTTLGLYVTAAQAYEKWKAAPDKVKVIDVRTPEEYAFIGHPEMAWNIPLGLCDLSEKGWQNRIQREDEYGLCRRGQRDSRADRHPAGHVPVR